MPDPTPRSGAAARRRQQVLRACSVLAAGLLAGAAPPASAETLVTLGFDDATPGQLAPAAQLDALGLEATFYVNTQNVGRPGRLTWAQVRDLAARGHEIGGHGVRHIDLTTLDDDAARASVCDDRQTLLREGLPATSFAYPNGHFTPAIQQIVRDCGYGGARTVGGVAPSAVCFGFVPCPAAESVPAFDPFATRTAPPANHATGLSGLQGAVMRAEASGGWLQLVFHHFDDANASAVSSATFAAFARWLAPRSVLGTRVVTAGQASGTPAVTTPHVAPVTASASRIVRVRPRDAAPHVTCPAACVVDVTLTPTSSSARRLGGRAGVPAAAGTAVLGQRGTLVVRPVPRPAGAASWRGVGTRVALRLRTTITALGPVQVR